MTYKMRRRGDASTVMRRNDDDGTWTVVAQIEYNRRDPDEAYRELQRLRQEEREHVSAG
jgi:hypothetical protein